MSRRLPRSLPMLAAATVLCVMAAGQAHPAGRADAVGCFLDQPVYGFDIAAVCKK